MSTDKILGAVVIGFFLVIPLIIGGVASRFAKSTTDDYFVQGRAMGSIAVFFTVTATWWSAFAFLGSNASFYLEGPLFWTALVWNVFFGVMYYWIGKRVWFHGKRGDYITARDFFADLFGSSKLATFIAIVILVFTLPHLQIQLTGGAYLLEVASGDLIPFWLGGLLFYLVIIIYVWAGGVRAVAWTDIFYGVTIFLGLIAAGVVVVGHVGGMGIMFDEIQQVQPDNLILGEGVWMTWITMFLITPLGALMGPQMWTRMYATKSPRLFDLMPFLVGLMAIAYLGSMLVGNSGTLLMPDIENADQVLPLVLLEYAPMLLALIVIAAGAGAAMSTANSQVHAMGASYTMDFHKRYFQKDLPERKMVWVGRWAILVFFTVFPQWAPGPFAVGGVELLALLLNIVVFCVVSPFTKLRNTSLLVKIRRRHHDFARERWDDPDPEATV